MQIRASGEKNALSDESTKLFRQRLKAALRNGAELEVIINDGLCKPEDIRWLDASQRVQAISSLMGLGSTSEYSKESALLKVLEATTGSGQAIAKEFIEKLDVGSNMSALLKQFDDLYGEEKFDGLFSALYRIWLKSDIGSTTDISVLYPLTFGYNKTKVTQEVRLEDEFVDVWVGEFKAWGATDIKTAFEGHQKYLNSAIGITFMEPNELFGAAVGTTISVPPFVLSYLKTRESNANLRAMLKSATHITINALAIYTGVQGVFVAKNGIALFFAWADLVSTSGAVLVSTDIVKAKLKDVGGLTDAEIESIESYLFATQLVTTGGVIISPKFAKFDDAHAALKKVGKENLEAIDPKLAKVKAQMDEMAGEIVGAEQVLAKGADDVVGTYTTTIKWGEKTVDARPFGNGYWGKRFPQKNPRVDAYEMKINPNNESYYLPLNDTRMVQFENISKDALQDGKLIMEKSSIYHIYDKPPVLRINILKEAKDQAAVAKKYGLKVEWLVSDEKAVDHLTRFFREENVEITVKLFSE